MNALSTASKFQSERKIEDEDFEYFQELIFNLAGITLGDKKRDLLLTRLGSYLRNSDFSDYSEYKNYLQTLPADHEEWQLLIN